MAVQPTENQSSSSSLPVWLSIPIILLCLGAGGWMIQWYVMNDPIDHSIKVLGDPAKLTNLQPFNRPPGNWNGGGNGGGPRMRPNTQVPSAQFRNGRWEITTETAMMYTAVDVHGNVNLRLRYIKYSFLNDNIKNQLGNVSLLLKNKEKLDTMSLNDAQKKRLAGLSNDPDMVASAADKQELKTAVSELIRAADTDRPKLEPNLFKLLDEVAQRSVPATMQAASDHVKEINAILAAAAQPVAAPATPAPATAAPAR
jgi:hypothetical protein